MLATATQSVAKYRRWLPYVAVLQTDIRQTFRNWGYRLWVLAMLLAAFGYITFRLGTLADSVLSRAISRHQYFMAKWHGRLASILGTVVALGVIMIVASRFLLHDNLTLIGSFVALVLVTSMLTVVVSGGVMLSALVPSTRVSMTVLWVVLYGGGLLLELLPKQYPTPDRILRALPNMFMGEYDSVLVLNVLGVTAAASCVIALVGLVGFSRRDV
jgi:ABC-2 type transport system permease protein